MHIIALDDLPATPWKNGGGITRELAGHPAGSDLHNFLWRLSVADVHQSGPFSHFPGIDRIITLLDGDGFRLDFANGVSHDLTAPAAPFCFSGDDAVDAYLTGTPSLDLNLMLRRGAVRGEVRAIHAATTLPTAQLVALICVSGHWDAISSDQPPTVLAARTALLGPFSPDPLHLRPLQPGTVLLRVTVCAFDKEDDHAS